MAPWVVFLGGHDLEMVEIARLLAGRNDVEVVDHDLRWGARASSYEHEIRDAVKRGQRVVLVELEDDLSEDIPRDQLIWVDHHNTRAGAEEPTSIEQVFRLLADPSQAWTRDLALVAANDRGHLAAMERLGATVQEMKSVRERDRRAQGITPDEEDEGLRAIARRTIPGDGRLTVVELPHDRAATVTDALDSRLGGPGYQNLLIYAPGQTLFFGAGQVIERLNQLFPGGWFGGELPQRGFWGIDRRVPFESVNTLFSETKS